MEREEVAKNVFIFLWNFYTSNGRQVTRVSLDDVVKGLNDDPSSIFTIEQIEDAIENDPYRQLDHVGSKTNVGLFEKGYTDKKLTSVAIPPLAYEKPRQWVV